MVDALSIDNLYALTDVPVQGLVKQVFTQQIQFSPSVHSLYFGYIGAPPVAATDADWVDNVAVALVCSSIGQSSLYGFSNTISQAAATGYWQTQLAYTSPKLIQASQVLYDWAFPAYCQAGGRSFQEYLNSNPQSWGTQLAAHLKSPTFINTEILKLISQQPSWLQQLNLLFYKLHRLNDAEVQGVLNAWQNAFPDKGIAVQWQSYNFVPLALFAPDLYIANVNAAISIDTEGSIPPAGNGFAGATTHTYGEGVVAFLAGKPSSLGFRTGNSPNNYTVHNNAACSFVAGTPILLADGRTVAIETVQENDEVLAQHGKTATQTDEQIVVSFKRDTTLYGINDLDPFFSPAHLFWTQDGWKAISPEPAMEVSPKHPVGELKVGDVVFRVSNLNPFTYEPVTIEKFTTRVLKAGEKLYALHLQDGPRSYHANGFCVGMNYPTITEGRLTRGFATLSDAERQLLATTLEPIMPLLKKAVGSFVEHPLKRALIARKSS